MFNNKVVGWTDKTDNHHSYGPMPGDKGQSEVVVSSHPSKVIVLQFGDLLKFANPQIEYNRATHQEEINKDRI